VSDTVSDEKIILKDYTTHSNRILNRLIRLREKQIKGTQGNKATTDKSVIQLQYEKETMTNILMERAMTK
jgi:hypothetical protein